MTWVGNPFSIMIPELFFHMRQFMNLWTLHPNKDHNTGVENLCGNTNWTGIIYSKKAFPPLHPDKCFSNGPLSHIAHHSNTVWLIQKATSHAFLLPFQAHYLCVALDGLQEICWSIHTNSMQNFTLLLDHSLCDSLGIPNHLSHMSAHDPPPTKKKIKEKQPAALVLNYSFWKALWYSILEAWKTTTWLSANCRNCTGKIGLRWLCLQIVFLVCLPRPTVPDKCSTERWPIREVDCTTQTNPLQKTSEARSRKKAKMVGWNLENLEGPFWKIRSVSVHNHYLLTPKR